MELKKISNSEAGKFLENNFSSPTHWPDWNLLISKYFNTNFFYWGYFENNSLTGIYPVHEVKYKRILKKRYSGQFHLIPNGGWIFSKPVKVDAGFFLKRKDVLTQNTTFSLPLLNEFNVSYNEIKTTPKATLIINLKKTEEEIWKDDINSKRRNMIRKSQKEGVEIKKFTDEQGLRSFYDVYREASKRFSARQLDYHFFEEMFFKSPNIQLHLYAAYKDNVQLANVGIVSDKDYSFYWLGNNANDAKNIGQGELLQWHTIKKMKEKGCKYYDLCYIEPEKLPHIYKFKKGFSKSEHEIKLINKKPLPFKVVNKLF